MYITCLEFDSSSTIWRGPKKKTIKKDHENKSGVTEGRRGKSYVVQRLRLYEVTQW